MSQNGVSNGSQGESGSEGSRLPGFYNPGGD